ncbi:MAG TPA: FHA domain-containing protein [Candidatus Acidoferrales bacterium]|nr:FHA domain-containing protein [Candidatus Acidoferrales bacterium]
MPRFLIYHPGEDARVFELLGDRPISIGRAKASSLVLDNPSISRLHAVVRSSPEGQWQIIDRGSANGVKVNGAATKEATLKPNDEIVLGEYRLRFFEDSPARNMITYGTADLPPRVARVIAEPAYSASFLPVQPLAGAALSDSAHPATSAGRLQALERENRLLTLLYRVNRALGDLSTVSDVTQRILELILEMEGAERSFVMLLNRQSMGQGDFSKGGYAFEPALIRHRRGANGPQGHGSPQLTISQSIIKQVMQGGLPLLVSDPQADPRLAASKSIVAAGIQSAMCAPLGMKERRFGLLYVDNLSRRGMFTVDDLNVFAVIAAQAGLAVDRVRLQDEAAEKRPVAAES